MPFIPDTPTPGFVADPEQPTLGFVPDSKGVGAPEFDPFKPHPVPGEPGLLQRRLRFSEGGTPPAAGESFAQDFTFGGKFTPPTALLVRTVGGIHYMVGDKEGGDDWMFNIAPRGVERLGERFHELATIPAGAAQAAAKKLGLGDKAVGEFVQQWFRQLPDILAGAAGLPGIVETQQAFPEPPPTTAFGKGGALTAGAGQYFASLAGVSRHIPGARGLKAAGAKNRMLALGARSTAAMLAAEASETDIDPQRAMNTFAMYFALMGTAEGFKGLLGRAMAKKGIAPAGKFMQQVAEKGWLRAAARAVPEHLLVERADDWMESVFEAGYFATKLRPEGTTWLGAFFAALPSSLFWNYVTESVGDIPRGMKLAAAKMEARLEGRTATKADLDKQDAEIQAIAEQRRAEPPVEALTEPQAPEGAPAPEIAATGQEGAEAAVLPPTPGEAANQQAQATEQQTQLAAQSVMMKDADVLHPAVERFVGRQNWMLEQARATYDRRKRTYTPAALEGMTLHLEYNQRPGLLDELYQRAPADIKKRIEASRALTDAERAEAELMRREYAQDAVTLQREGILDSLVENYVNHIWQLEGKRGKQSSRFGARMKESLKRSIQEGYIAGMVDAELKPLTLDAAKLRRIYEESKAKAISERQFLNSIKHMVMRDGKRLLAPMKDVRNDPDYNGKQSQRLANEPALRKYAYRGTTEEGAVLLEKMPLAIHNEGAKRLQSAIGTSAVRDIGVARKALKVTALGKNTLLSFSFFHHTALAKTAIYYWVDPRPIQIRGLGNVGYRVGLDLIESGDPIVELLVKHGLTLSASARVQFATELAQEALGDVEGYIEGITDKLGLSETATGVVLSPIKTVRAAKRWWDTYLWRHYYTGLKALAGRGEFYRNLKRHPNLSREDVARVTSRDINDNFGGLNWRVMGVDPTNVDLARLALLAPDWTLSNWRFFYHAARGMEGDLRGGMAAALNYVQGKGPKPENMSSMADVQKAHNINKGAGRYMMRVILTLQGVVAAANIALWGTPFPQDEEDKDKWYMIKLPNTDEGGRHYYLDLHGHFFEPVRAVLDPYRWAKGKQSFLARGVQEQIQGRNWRDDYIGTVKDLLEGKLYRSRYEQWPEAGFAGWKQIPNRVIHGASAFLPIPVRTGFDAARGERPAFEMLNMTGLKVTRERATKKRQRRPSRKR